MLQIIIWMGCVLLLLIGLHFLRTAQDATEGSNDSTYGFIGAVIAVASAILFFFLAGNQAERANSYLGASTDTNGAYQGKLSTAERSAEGLTPAQLEMRDKYVEGLSN